jgi:hypothetical protein
MRIVATARFIDTVVPPPTNNTPASVVPDPVYRPLPDASTPPPAKRTSSSWNTFNLGELGILTPPKENDVSGAANVDFRYPPIPPPPPMKRTVSYAQTVWFNVSDERSALPPFQTIREE